MKKASAVLYLIAAIFGAILVVTYVLLAVFGFMGKLAGVAIYGDLGPTSAGISLIISAIIACVATFLAFHGYKLSKTGSKKTGFHIFCNLFF